MMSPHADLQSRAECFQKSIEQFIDNYRHDEASGVNPAVSITNCGPVSGGLSGERHTRRRCFAVLPSRVEPRWLLPLGDSRATLEALQVYSDTQVASGVHVYFQAVSADVCDHRNRHRQRAQKPRQRMGALAGHTVPQAVQGEPHAGASNPAGRNRGSTTSGGSSARRRSSHFQRAPLKQRLRST